MTQGSLLALGETAELSPLALETALRGRGWVHRADLALSLGVSIRAVRNAANEAHGAILSANQGLKLTCEASEAEVDECCGRFVSQIAEMSKRVVSTRMVWERRMLKESV
jgi:hypothetical protein